MQPVERCGLPYDHHGDWTECRLDYNHDRSCYEANHAADTFRASLHERTRQAQTGPWL